MKACLLPAALGLLALATPLQARDARLAARPYNASEVVRIDGRAGVQAAIAFADDELIENVAIGDSASWQVTPNKRATMLFLKPLSATARTNMTVVTDKRSYFFDLVASPKAQPLYVLRFTYPEPAGGSRRAGTGMGRDAAGPLTPAETLALGTAPADATPDPAPDPAGDLAGNIAGQPAPAGAVDPAALNFAWAGKGKRQLLPARIYDDGASTYLTWTAGTAMPAILVRDAAGTEGPVNFAVREDVVVIEGVPRLLVLRSGRDTAMVENRGKPRSRAPAPAAPTLVAAAASAPQPSAPATPASPQQDN